jgi:hypothetical protein
MGFLRSAVTFRVAITYDDSTLMWRYQIPDTGCQMPAKGSLAKGWVGGSVIWYPASGIRVDWWIIPL